MKRLVLISAVVALGFIGGSWFDGHGAQARGGPAAFIHVTVNGRSGAPENGISVAAHENNDGDWLYCTTGSYSQGTCVMAATDGESEDTQFGVQASKCYANDYRVWQSGTAWRGLGVTYTTLNLHQTNYTC